MKIYEVSLRDFQAHRKTRLEFSPGVTTIVGDSDKGKSAILRGLRWALLNDFAGDTFIREGAKSAVVSVWGKEKKQTVFIRRERGTENTYLLEIDDAGEKEFASFGQTVPPEIASVLRLSELNFQSQHDAPFWFDLSGGDLSRALNSIVDLSLIDTSLANISKMTFRARERVTLAVERQANTVQALQGLQSDQRITDFKALKLVKQEFDVRHRRTQDCIQAIVKIDRLYAPGAERKAVKAEELVAFAKAYRSASNAAAKLHNLIVDLDANESKLAPPNFSSVNVKYSHWSGFADKRASLSTLIDNWNNANNECSTAEGLAKMAEHKFHSTIEGHNCPLCQQKIKTVKNV